MISNGWFVVGKQRRLLFLDIVVCLGGGSFESVPNSIPFGVFGRGLCEDYFASGIVAGVELGEHRLGIGGGVFGKNRNMRKAACFWNGAVGNFLEKKIEAEWFLRLGIRSVCERLRFVCSFS